VAVQAWIGNGRVLSLDTSWDRTWASLREHRVDALSATPTFCDLLLQNETQNPNVLSESEWAPRQITLGGEPLRPATGARLRDRFPRTRFCVIYAAAEFGVLLKTSRLDGWYETDGLPRGSWRIEQGVLEWLVGNQWRSTRDCVELQHGLLRVIGRADAVANVGGTKVCLAQVADLAERVGGVRRAAAVALPNDVTGEVVGLRYALDEGGDPEHVRQQLEAFLRAHLPKTAWPRHWMLDEIGIAPSSKRA
jgi:acyl-CoA synthetase (AMP-forming)/AMP-acid ligase II